MFVANYSALIWFHFHNIFHHRVHTDSDVHPVSCSVGTRIKPATGLSWPLYVSSFGVKNLSRFSSILPLFYIACCLVQQKDVVTFCYSSVRPKGHAQTEGQCLPHEPLGVWPLSQKAYTVMHSIAVLICLLMVYTLTRLQWSSLTVNTINQWSRILVYYLTFCFLLAVVRNSLAWMLICSPCFAKLLTLNTSHSIHS